MRERASFTLIEILTALLILSIVVTGVMSTFTVSRRYVGRSRRRLQAVNLARQILEGLYSEVRQDTWGDTATNRLWRNQTGTDYVDGILYSWTMNVSAVSNRDYRRVNVAINWTEPGF